MPDGTRRPAGWTDSFSPGWPRGMSEEMAAAYIGLSPSILRRESDSGKGPKRHAITSGRNIYLREELDGYLDRIAGKASPSATNSFAHIPYDDWDDAHDGTGGAAIP